MWDLPGPGLEPVFPALAGRFLTTMPPGKPHPLVTSNLLSVYTNLPLLDVSYNIGPFVSGLFRLAQ